jgi:hypothetical protein
MGPQLLEYVERALLEDLHHYGIAPDGLRIDWSDPVQEGHVTHYLDGMLEEMSDVTVLDADGEPLTEGWIDFVRGAPDAPLFVFWLYLRRRDGDRWTSLKDKPNLPAHVWSRLPERSKDLCATEGKYDARWRNDPLVQQWRAARR